MNKGISIQINQLSDIALYEQIAEQLKEQIIAGALEEHRLLPSVRGLAQVLNVSVITTRRAYTELEQQGYVITIPAKGTFVSYRYREKLKELGLAKLNEMISDVAYLAKALEVDEETLLHQMSAHCDYVQTHEYSPAKAHQILSQFIRKR